MTEEELEKFMISFISDKAIPFATRFNLSQTMLKLYNAGGGNDLSSEWNTFGGNSSLPKVTIDGVDIVSINSLALIFFAYYICVKVKDSLKNGGQVFK